MTGTRELLRTRGPAIAVVAAVVLAGSALQLLNQAGLESWRSIWAEDGSEWFRGAQQQGLGAFAHAHAGYLTTLPRILAVPTPWVPLGGLAVYFAVVGAVTTSLLAVAVYVLCGTWIETRALRALLAFATMFLPVLAFENLANATNTIWPLLFACFWALLYHPRSRGWAAFAALVVALAALSNALAALYVPIALAMWFRCRDRLHRAVLVTFAAALAVQAVVAVTGTGGPSGAAHGLVQQYAVRVLASALVGEKWLEQLWRSGGYTLVLPFAFIVAIVVIVLAACAHGARRVLGMTAIGYSIAMFVVPVAIRGTAAMPLEPGFWFSGGARYAALSIWLVLSGICLLIEGVPADEGRRAWMVTAAAIPVIVASVFGFQAQNVRSDGPDWRAGLRTAGVECRDRDRRFARVPVAPPGARLTVRVECADLR